MTYVLDTCTMIWWTNKAEKLSETVKRILTNTSDNHFVISSISFWETGIKIKRGILDIGMAVEDYVRKMQMAAEVSIISVDENIWIENLNLNWEHRDPADRTIVATAKLRSIPIITKDRIIRDYYSAAVW